LPSVQISILGNDATKIEEMIKSKIVTRFNMEGPLSKDKVRFNFEELQKYLSFQIRMEEKIAYKDDIIHRSFMR
jgi:hypothetical protein